MTTSENNDSPSELAIPGVGGVFEPIGTSHGDDVEPESDMPEEEDDERHSRELERERRAEDENP